LATEAHQICQEIEILKKCQSPYVVSYFGSFVHKNLFWILMDYCSGGSLRDILDVVGRPLSEKQIAEVMFPVLSGLHFLTINHVVHGDVKPANLLLTEDGETKLGKCFISNCYSIRHLLNN